MVPDFQTIMLPLLRVISDEKEHRFRDVVEKLASFFQLSELDRKELLPSGTAPVFDNRVGWAKTYLKKAGLLENNKRSILVITKNGKQILESRIEKITTSFLTQFSTFNQFRDGYSIGPIHVAKLSAAQSDSSDYTPEEILEKGYQDIRRALISDVTAQTQLLSSSAFEKLVVKLLVKMGYGGSEADAGQALGRSGDEGIDGIIKEDKLGLDVIYIQAKRWAEGNVVGRPEIQKFVGALAGQGAKKGIFITTSSFSKEASDYTPRNETKIVLIDGKKLANLMIDNNLGVSLERIYEVKKIDSDFFEGSF
ncbi:MAG: restriction endonuclease [Bacteroidetes bacterium]|nr:restriction endonuclease [Bacteroidota bacterium]